MKIAVTTNNGGLGDSVCQIFGRCPSYTIIDYVNNEVGDVKIVDNPGFSAQGGAGIQAAQFVINEKIEAVISGNFGPNASEILMRGGVKMYQIQGNVKEAVEKCVNGELKPLGSQTVNGHFGMGGMGHRHGQNR